MSEARAIAPNGLTLASLFSGCGGSCLGFRLAGYRVVYANEFVAAARDTYRANFPETPIDPRDVREVNATSLRDRAETALGSIAGSIDVLEGSPPCAAFSSAGRREHSWNKKRAYSDTAQRTDDLFFEFARILRELQPRAFVAENVSGLVRGVSKGYFLDIRSALLACGYRVRAKLLDAQWLGVPQHRERLIFIGLRDDLRRAPEFPAPFAYRHTVEEVLPALRRIKGTGSPDNWFTSARAYPTIAAQSAVTKMGAYFSSAFVETATGERRRLTIEEVKLLSSFPHDFILTGSFEQQWERVARAVPPLMMRAIAARLAEQL